MNFAKMFEFLDRLQRNNSKDWMDAHRTEYKDIRSDFVGWLDIMNTRLADIDSDYYQTPGKKAINRINNNLMFFPDKPVYKDHFSGGLDQLSKQGDFYIEIGITDCFVGGGYWHPSSHLLKSIRNAIDYNGSEFVTIINKPSFKKWFGELIPSEELKTAPKGFDVSHEHINLLRRKSFAAGKHFTREQVVATNFEDQLVLLYQELLPFRRYLNEAVTV